MKGFAGRGSEDGAEKDNPDIPDNGAGCGFVGEAFEDEAEKDESDITVYGAGCGIGGQWRGENGLQKLGAGAGFQEKVFVGGQAGRVRQQHADGYLAAAGIFGGVGSELGD